jgi:hypothetical protein
LTFATAGGPAAEAAAMVCEEFFLYTNGEELLVRRV